MSLSCCQCRVRLKRNNSGVTLTMLKAKSRILFATKRGDKLYDNATFPDITDISDTFIMTFMSTMFVEAFQQQLYT